VLTIVDINVEKNHIIYSMCSVKDVVLSHVCNLLFVVESEIVKLVSLLCIKESRIMEAILRYVCWSVRCCHKTTSCVVQTQSDQPVQVCGTGSRSNV